MECGCVVLEALTQREQEGSGLHGVVWSSPMGALSLSLSKESLGTGPFVFIFGHTE